MLEVFVASFGVFLHRGIYLAVVEYLVIYFALIFLIVFFCERASVTAGGCFAFFLLLASQVFSLIIVVITISPIILGVSDSAAWAAPFTLIFNLPFEFLALAVKVSLASALLSIIPIAGTIRALHTVVPGAIVLGFVLEAMGVERVVLFPGFWAGVVLVAVSGVLSFLVFAGFTAVLVRLGAAGVRYGQYAAAPLGALAGFVPLFIYAEWLVRTLQ